MPSGCSIRGVFYADYREDGWGRAAHDPAMMVALLLYAYALGERSSRAIERRCLEDVAFRVICPDRAPDHATIARFRVRHEQALAGPFTQVLALCARAGLVSVGPRLDEHGATLVLEHVRLFSRRGSRVKLLVPTENRRPEWS